MGVASGIVVVGGAWLDGFAGVGGGRVGTSCWHFPKLKEGGMATPLTTWITPLLAGMLACTI